MALAQAAYRFGSNDGTESTHGFLAALNTPIVRSQSDASTFLLRILVQASGGVAHNNLDFQFQLRKNGGAFSDITTSSANVRAVSTTVFANAENTTSRLGGTGTFESSSQGCTHDGLSGGNQFDIVANGRGETVCSLQLVPADLAGGDLLEFQLLADGAPLDAYTVIPSITVQGTAAGALAATEPADTAALAGTVLVQGSLSATEAADALSAPGDVIVAGVLSATDAPDTFAASGTVEDASVTGTLAATEAVDTVSATGALLVQGALVASEAGPDTISATGMVLVQGALAATGGQDTASVPGEVLVRGTVAATEAPDSALINGAQQAHQPSSMCQHAWHRRWIRNPEINIGPFWFRRWLKRGKPQKPHGSAAHRRQQRRGAH